MPNVEHSTLLGGGEIHEPKGINNSLEGQVYVADGSESGDWTYLPTGWGFYQDGGSAQVFNTTAAKITIDGAGSLTSEAHLPHAIRGTGSLWDTTNNKITPIETGDKYDLRVDLPVTNETGFPTELTIEFDIGGVATPTVVILSRFLPTGKSTPYTISFGMPILALTDTTTNNGIQLFAYTDSGTVTVTNPSITIGRDHAGSL